MNSTPPVIRDERSAPFFDAAASGTLLIRVCARCSHCLEPEARVCFACGSDDLNWSSSSGHGVLVSWAVVHQPPHPTFANLVPFAIGLVELEEGPWLHARIAGIPLDRLHAGIPLHAAFVHPDGADSYPYFTAGGPA